ncbi:hypothetical protein [Gordonia sihwensis]|uniref:hypothetical protein n=1 Tax=Gordonia sihwensis TaxID=173559 RepID=UPI003D953115
MSTEQVTNKKEIFTAASRIYDAGDDLAADPVIGLPNYESVWFLVDQINEAGLTADPTSPNTVSQDAFFAPKAAGSREVIVIVTRWPHEARDEVTRMSYIQSDDGEYRIPLADFRIAD